MKNKPYLVLAYYAFVPVEDPIKEVEKHQAFLKNLDFTCRIYLSEQGINGQASASLEAAEKYMEWLRADERFSSIVFKIHEYDQQVFPRQTIKYRKQLAALDATVNPAHGGEHVPPEQWLKMLKNRDPKNSIVIDTRNYYEWAVGHFEGADLPELQWFRQFPAYVQELKKQKNPEELEVMMYCTGGIRCELYSALMIQEGFKKVYQLEGGIINYGLQMGCEGWRGKLFVFDERLVVPISDDEATVIGKCVHCHAASESYYNCANPACNELFLCCLGCAERLQTCCSHACLQAPRRRVGTPSLKPKPFKRAHQVDWIDGSCSTT